MATSETIETRPATGLKAFYPYLLLTICMLCWSGNWIAGRLMREGLPPVALNFWRWTLAALILTPIAWPRLRGKLPLIRRHWRILLALGVMGSAIFQVMIYTGLRYTEAINATLMNSASPLFIILIAWMMEGERATSRQIAGMLISFFGIIVILTRGELTHLAQLRFNIGDLLILIAMPGWGFYAVLLRRRPQGFDTVELLYLIALGGIAVMLPAYLIESLFFLAPPLSWGMVGAVAYVGSFASVFAYFCWNRGVELVGPNKAGFTMHLLPAFATILAVIVLGEQVHLFHAVGIATIIFGVWLATSARTRRA